MIAARVNLAVVGVFVLIALGSLLAALAILAGRTGAVDEYHAVFGNVAGLKYGSQVLYEGYPIGQVESIEPEHEEDRVRFRVRMTVAAGWIIPEDSVARSEASGLLAPQTIAISAGKSARRLEPGDAISSADPAGLFTSLNAVVQERVPAIMANVERAAAAVAVAGEGLATVVTPERVERIDRMLVDAEAAMASLRQSSRQLQGLLEGAGPELSAGLKDFHDTMESLSRNAEPFSQNLNLASRNLQDFSRQLRNNPGLLLRGSEQPDDTVPPYRRSDSP